MSQIGSPILKKIYPTPTSDSFLQLMELKLPPQKATILTTFYDLNERLRVVSVIGGEGCQTVRRHTILVPPLPPPSPLTSPHLPSIPLHSPLLPPLTFPPLVQLEPQPTTHFRIQIKSDLRGSESPNCPLKPLSGISWTAASLILLPTHTSSVIQIHTILQWLDIASKVTFKLCLLEY